MSQYTEEEINKIIDNCENLIIPDESAITFELDESPKVVEIKQIKTPKSVILTRYLNQQSSNSEEYFENFFQECKRNKQKKIAETDHATEIQLYDDSSERKSDPEDAVFVNNMLKKRLIQFRTNIEASINKINERLKELEVFLEDAKSNDTKDAMSFKTSYIKCGMPYFKDALCYPAPENDDFKYRKNVLKELFPFDLPAPNIKWKTKEKVDLVNGIKNQMISHVKLQQSKKICQDSKTRGKMQKLRFISHNPDLNEMSISNLYESINSDYPDFQINWNLISFNDLHSNHSVTECMGMWFSYLKPDINREPFTHEENAILSQLATDKTYQSWNEIAEQLDRRSSLQAFSYFQSESAKFCPANVRWTPEEDDLLLDGIKKSTTGGVTYWNKVCSSVPNRNKAQCYNRYLILSKGINCKKGVFSAQENRVLLNYVAQYGDDFSKMPENVLPNRTTAQIKNHYNIALKHKGKVNPWTGDEDQKLMDFVKAEGTNNWKKIADLLETHNRLSCRTRYLTISKFLAKNPKKTLKDVPSRLKTITAVQKAIESESEEEEDMEEPRQPLHSKSFGIMPFEEFKSKNLPLYHLFKTTYGYKLNVQEVVVDFPRFLFLKSALNIEHYGLQRKYMNAFTPTQYTKINEALSTNLDSSLEAEIIQARLTSNFLLPLNFHTAVGLRSVAIKMEEDEIDEDERSVLNPSNQEYDKSLKEFQQLFISLFYWPAMLSKIKATEIMNWKGLKRQSVKQVKFFKINPSSAAIVEIPLKRSAEQKFYRSAKIIKIENQKK